MQPRHTTILSLLIFLILTSQFAWAGVITPGLQEQLGSLKSEEMITVLVVMSEKVDVTTLDAQLHEQKVARRDRHMIVVSQLQEMAEVSQKSFITDLNELVKQGLVIGYTPHWLINAVVVRGTEEAILTMSNRADVARIEADLRVSNVKELPVPDQHAEKIAGGITPGMVAIQANRVWNELGIDGTGVVVGILDTGVDSTHPALSSRWRGNFAPASECWFDVADVGSPDLPVDLGSPGHGTHVMGTITGQAPQDSIGVAPGAQWIASNPILLDAGAAVDNAIIAGLEFMADPDGDPGTIEDVPVVVNNSWGVHEGFDGYYDCDSRWWDAIDNCEAAGVCLVWAAGNEGPFPGSLRSPADRATSPYNCFSVGATSFSAPFDVADFSARGPSGCGGAFTIKPELCAPGSFIYSSVPGGGYETWNGTSMATPHIAGVVALMNQANPELDVTSIKQILMDTATDLGAAGEDNEYGYGIVNAFDAVMAALEEAGSVLVTVLDMGTGLPQPNAMVTVEASGFSILTDETGQATIHLGSGEYSLAVEKFGYYEAFGSVSIENNEDVNLTISMETFPTVQVSGQVRATNGGFAPEATITFLDTPLEPALVDEFGYYEITVPVGFDFQVRASAPGFSKLNKTLTVMDNFVEDFTIMRLSSEDFETGDFSQLDWQFSGDLDWWIDSEDPASGNFSASSAVTDFTTTLSELFLTLEVVEGEISFDVKTATNPSTASLNFRIDGQVVGNYYGETDWTHVSYPISAGVHTFSWRYGSQLIPGRTWIDNVDFPLPLIEPEARIALDSEAIDISLADGATTSVPLLIHNAGGLDLDFQFNGQNMDWLSAQPANAIVTAYDSLSVALNFSAAGMNAGTFTGDLIINSNDPGNLETIIPITMTVTPGTSGVSDSLPLPLTLSAAPNPFNPMTRLYFSLPGDSSVKLIIYDLAGRRVRSLISGDFTAGQHEILWRGVNDNDEAMASGTYLALLRTDSDQQIIKLSLTR